MEKFKINLICNDSLKPSTSDKNVSQHTEWVYDGSGASKSLRQSKIVGCSI